MSIDSVGNAVRTVATNADSVQQTNTSPWDVMSHTMDGLGDQSTADVVGRVVPAVGAGRAIAGMGEGVIDGGVHSSSLGGTAEGIEAQANVIGEQFSNFFSDDPTKNPEGVLANVGATFNLLTSVEQLWSMGFGMIPFPAFPALRVTDMDVGLPHAHSHPPNLTPPNPVPVPLPSTGPVIPIPLLSGASRTLINGLPAARCGDMGLGIWCGGYVPMFEVFLGSATVWIEGSRAGRMGVDITNHCIFSARPGDPPIGLFTGTTISGSPNTMIGGVPLPSMLSLGMGAMFRGLGGLLKKLKPKKLVQEAGDAADDAAKAFSRTNPAKAADDLDPTKLCFAPETLVTTEDGAKPIRDVRPGEQVHAFDFENNQWQLSEVVDTHSSRFAGEIVSVSFEGESILATANHPFWVSHGDSMADREVPPSLSAGEDEGYALEGRWVNSQDLKAGDQVFSFDGKTRTVSNVEVKQVENYEVCNLTIKSHHSFAVGDAAVLVHNKGWCDILKSVADKPKALLDRAKQLGQKPGYVHAHHVVQKKVIDPAADLAEGSFDYYVQQSQKILRDKGVPLLDDISDAAKRADAGETLHNLRWALNGQGTHTTETVKAVHEALSKAGSKAEVEQVLKSLGDKLERGEKLY